MKRLSVQQHLLVHSNRHWFPHRPFHFAEAAFSVFFNDSFTYIREVHGQGQAVLEFEVELQGILVNGVDMISWNDAGLITEFKVMIRPLKAVNLIHQNMAALLQNQQ